MNIDFLCIKKDISGCKIYLKLDFLEQSISFTAAVFNLVIANGYHHQKKIWYISS